MKKTIPGATPMGGGRNLSAKFEGVDFQDALRLRGNGKANFYGSVAGTSADYLNSKFTAKITLTNVVARDVKVVLHPGYFTSIEDINKSRGLSLDCIATEGDIHDTANVKVLTGKGEPYNIIEFLQFTRFNPQCFTHLKLSVDQAEQLDNIIEIKYLSPYRSLGDDRFTPANYKTADQTNPNIADMPLPNFQMSNQTLVYTTISAGRRATYLWTVGAVLNTAALLQEASNAYAEYLANIANRK